MSRADPALDVLVLGGGPAGSACAGILAEAGSRVALVEATDYSQFRVGEILDASARPLLARLGLSDPEAFEWAGECSGIGARWGGERAEAQPSLFNPYGHGLRLDRKAFDHALFERASARGAVGLTTTRLESATWVDGLWHFTLRSAGKPMAGRAKWIVATTGRGRNAPLAPSRSQLRLDRLVSIVFAGDRSVDLTANSGSSGLVEAGSSGWWYSVTTPSGSSIVAFFTDADLLPKGKQSLSAFLLDQLRQCTLKDEGRETALAAIAERRWKGFDAHSGIRRIPLGQGWVAAGDTLMAFDPLCGRGIVEALTSGIEIAEWLLAGTPTERNGLPGWVERAAQKFNAYAIQRAAIYACEQRWSDLPFWRRRNPNITAFDQPASTRPATDAATSQRASGRRVAGAIM